MADKLNLKALSVFTPMPETESQKAWREYVESYPLHFVDGDTWVANGSPWPTQWGDGGVTTMWAHVIMDLDGDHCLDVDMLGSPPHDQGAFSWGEQGWEELLGCDGYNSHYESTNALQWMLQNGIAPGQRVWLEVEVEWTGGGYWDHDDVDCSYASRVMWIEPWTTEQIIAAWEEYLERGEPE